MHKWRSRAQERHSHWCSVPLYFSLVQCFITFVVTRRCSGEETTVQRALPACNSRHKLCHTHNPLPVFTTHPLGGPRQVGWAFPTMCEAFNITARPRPMLCAAQQLAACITLPAGSPADSPAPLVTPKCVQQVLYKWACCCCCTTGHCSACACARTDKRKLNAATRAFCCQLQLHHCRGTVIIKPNENKITHSIAMHCSWLS